MMKAISIRSIGALGAIIAGCLTTGHSASATGKRYPWKKNIVTTIFWIGESPSGNNPVKFTPRQNPFYCALPYNDKEATGHRPEAPRVVPWFKEAYQGPAVSTCKD